MKVVARNPAGDVGIPFGGLVPSILVKSEPEDPAYTTSRAVQLRRGRSRSHFRKLLKETPALRAAILRANRNGERFRERLAEAKAGDIIGVEPGGYMSGRGW